MAIRRRWPCVLAGLGCLALVVLLGVAVGPRANAPDEGLQRTLQAPLSNHPYRRAVRVLATETGWPHAAYVLALLPVVVAGAMSAIDAAAGRTVRWREWRWMALAVVAVPLQHGLRLLFDRTGPAVPAWADGDRGAYPSGAALLLALGWATGLVVLGQLRPRWRRAAATVAAVVLALHAVARVAAEKHWATDVLGSYLLVAGVLLLAAASRR